MLNRTIDSALQNLRRDLLRNGGEGLEHVEALMRLRGVTPEPRRRYRKPDCAKRGDMRRLVLSILSEGPKTMRELVPQVHAGRPELSREAAYQRTGQTLVKLKQLGLVGREGRVWATVVRCA